MANGHGGARPGSGPKPLNIDTRRMIALLEQGVDKQAIADRFGVSRGAIQGAVRRAKKNGLLKQ